MPVRTVNRRYYGQAWKKQVRPAIIARATVQITEQLRSELTRRHGAGYNTDLLEAMVEVGQTTIARCECSGECGHDHPGGRCPELDRTPALGFRGMVVLTVAHLDQRPWNNDPSNLRALCQACHNRLDAPYRGANAAETRVRNSRRAARDAGQLDLAQLDPAWDQLSLPCVSPSSGRREHANEDAEAPVAPRPRQRRPRSPEGQEPLPLPTPQE